MEKIKVNMSPNPLDVQTIHASQNDGEARQWEFELHNNGELIDTSEITEQMVIKSYKGGTEQLLPENGSTPTTSPFLGDIRYPQGLLTDQEFTYRQSPTEEDGLAKITDIKGNTLVWNQLVQNGNFADKSNWIESNATFTVNNNIATMVASASDGNIEQILSVKANHMYFATCDIKLTTGTNLVQFRPYVSVSIQCASTTEWQTLSGLFIPTTSEAVYYPRISDTRASDLDAIQIRNCMVIDLTQMGLNISSPSDFTSLFTLSYYSYNQGSLLSFNGNGIKTVGFNQWDEQWETGGIDVQNGNPYTDNSRIRTKNFNQCFENTVYYNFAPQQAIVCFYDGNFGYLGYVGANARSTFATKANARYFKFYMATAYGTTYNNDICINISSSRNGEYEPYTSSTLSLPISTYFPTGMKSTKNAYDELSPTKANVRIGSITFNGSEEWIKSTTYTGNYYVRDILHDAKYPKPDAISNRLVLVYNTSQLSENDLCFMFDGEVSSLNVNIKNTSMTTVDQFKAWLQANPVTIYYELKTPTETSFTTASLVTENAEIPLSNEDGTLIGKCTEELSAEPGFHDAKIKLADSDGECYSNKIQLHVERKPS